MKIVGKYHNDTNKKLLFFSILVSVFALVICGLGIWLIYLGSNGETKFEFVGQKFESNNVGITSIFIGSIVLIYTVSKMMKTFEKSSENYTKSIDTILSNHYSETAEQINSNEQA